MPRCRGCDCVLPDEEFDLNEWLGQKEDLCQECLKWSVEDDRLLDDEEWDKY